MGLLAELYQEVIVPMEVAEEMAALRSSQFILPEFERLLWLKRWPKTTQAAKWLSVTLDRGEASVIQLAINEGISTVCIDEAAGRRAAKLSGLLVTGSIGILLRAKREGKLASVRQTLERMRASGVWLSESLVRLAMAQAGE